VLGDVQKTTFSIRLLQRKNIDPDLMGAADSKSGGAFA
jgi:hypothetical protein